MTKVHNALSDICAGDDANMNISWSAHFANLQASVLKPPAITASTVLGQCIFTCYGKAWDEHYQTGQQLYRPRPDSSTNCGPACIAKQIQWIWPHNYGERHYVVLMGGIHIEMKKLNLHDD